MSFGRGVIDAGRPRAAAAVVALIVALALVTVRGATPGAARAASSPAPVPCSAIGGGKYDCQFYPAGDGYSAGAPVQASDASQVGYLNHGTNWITCERVGGTVISGSYENDWWGYTEANDGQWGWVNAVWASGGDNFGPFGGVPACADSVGLPPGAQSPPSSGSTVTPPPPPPPPPPSSPAPAPAHLRVRLAINWHVDAARTRVLRVRLSKLPGRARVRLQCHGRRCPFRLRVLTRHGAERQLARTFSSGDVVRLTITAPGFVPEVAQLRFRARQGPRGAIVSR